MPTRRLTPSPALWLLFTLGLVFVDLTLVPRPVLARPVGPTVAILHTFEAPDETTRELRNAVTRAVHLMSGDVLPHAFFERQLASCDDEACRIEVARLASADFVLVLSGRREAQSFELTTRIFSGATGALSGERSKTCELCALKELYEAAEDQAAALLARASQSVEEPRDTGPAAPPAWRTPAAWILTGVGAAATALGAYGWITDGDCARRAPTRGICISRKENAFGPWVTIGGLLLTTGGVLMVTGVF